MKRQSNYRKLNGFSILEVVIGIFIFVVGMLALAALQGALSRSMADAKLRTTAVNLADRMLERQRGFTQLLTAVTPGVPFAYNDIVTPGTDSTVTLNGVTYTIDMNVADYYYQLSTDTFTTTNTAGALSSNYKQVDVTVSWDAVQDFRAGEGEVVDSGDINTGSVTLTSTIPAIITSASGQVSDEEDGDVISHPITYTPGLNPDIVSLSLGDNKFKESLLPEPEVFRDDERVETRFDVVTYSQTEADGARFLRREEFASVACDCTLKAPDANVDSRRPVIWAGDEYVRGQVAMKPYGVPANGTQSPLCTACCRDHHDGGTATDPADSSDASVNTYVPFKPNSGPSSEFLTTGTFANDHKHYARSRTGTLTLVTTANSDYVESCRMVRVDGFFRVAQDFRREDLNIFPNDFLDSTDEIDVYSDYVTTAAGAYVTAATGSYTASPPCIGRTGTGTGTPQCTTPVAFPTKQGAWDAPLDLANNELPSWTNLPLNAATTQQLRSRGVYIDYLSSDLRHVLENCDPDTGDVESTDCKHGDIYLDRTGSLNTLELIPFFDVQMTRLNRWNESPTNSPVDTTNEPLEDLNTHSRGVISKIIDGMSTVTAEGQRGNIGFTDTLPIDLTYASQETNTSIVVHAGSPSTPPVGITVSGNLSETVPGNPNIVLTGLGGVQCGQTSASYSCFIPDGTVNPRLEISGYGKDGTTRWACSVDTSLMADLVNTVTNGANAKATFNLGTAVDGTTNYNFVINQSDTDPCT